jgi:hypothetical protein
MPGSVSETHRRFLPAEADRRGTWCQLGLQSLSPEQMWMVAADKHWVHIQAETTDSAVNLKKSVLLFRVREETRRDRKCYSNGCRRYVLQINASPASGHCLVSGDVNRISTCFSSLISASELERNLSLLSQLRPRMNPNQNLLRRTRPP